MKTKIIAALVTAAALPVFAQSPATPVVDQRQANQQARIQQGVQSGQLTNKETARLEAGQARVENKEAAAKADGKVTPKERASLAKSQNKQSKQIAKAKHNKKKKAPAA